MQWLLHRRMGTNAVVATWRSFDASGPDGIANGTFNADHREHLSALPLIAQGSMNAPMLGRSQVTGDALRSRADRSEATEVDLAAAAMNRMLAFGRPNHVRIAYLKQTGLGHRVYVLVPRPRATRSRMEHDLKRWTP